MFSLCIDALKGPTYYPQNIMLQFVIIKTLHENINFRDQAWNRLPAKCWVKDFILPHKRHAEIFIEDPGNLKHPKNVKSINIAAGSHRVSCRVISRPATIKGREKEVF